MAFGTYTLIVTSPGGTRYAIGTNNLQEANNFLSIYDHEGAGLEIRTEDGSIKLENGAAKEFITKKLTEMMDGPQPGRPPRLR